MNKPIFLVGDLHGKFPTLIEQIYRYGITDSTIIILGDIGLGFHSKEKESNLLEHLSNTCNELNLNIYLMRGNHDNPSYWEGSLDYSNIHLLPDGFITIEDTKFFCVGGAISVDRQFRKEGVSYWGNEVINYEKIEKLLSVNQEVDVVLTHATCNEYLPVVSRDFGIDLDKDLKKERDFLSKVYKKFPNQKWYFGHFHLSANVGNGKCLDELEFYQLTY